MGSGVAKFSFVPGVSKRMVVLTEITNLKNCIYLLIFPLLGYII